SSPLFTFKEVSSPGSSTGTGDCLSGSVLPYTERITLKSFFSTFSTSTGVTESSSFPHYCYCRYHHTRIKQYLLQKKQSACKTCASRSLRLLCFSRLH